MESLNDHIRAYTLQLSEGHIQQAYRGIMTFMSGLRTYLENKYHNYAISSLYFGYMDMTYFAFTPSNLKAKQLKIAIVYIHEQGRFEAWLGGNNRKIQAETIQLLKFKNSTGYQISQVKPGVDSIIESTLVAQPDFDHPEELKKQIEKKVIEFINDINFLLN